MFDFKESSASLQFRFEGSWPTAVALLGGGRLVAGNQLGQLFVWQLPESIEKDAVPPEPLRRLDGHTNGISRLVTLSDGKTVISSSLDHTVRIWDLDAPASGTVEAVMDMDSRKAEAKRTRKDDVLTQPGVTVETQTAAHVLEGHGDWVQSLGISRDERRLITGDDRGLTIVWDLAERKPISQWIGYPGNWISSAALSPDGTKAFTAEYCFKRDDFDRPPAQARFWNAADGTETLDVLKVQFPDVKVRDNSYGYAQVWGKFMAQGFWAADFSPDGTLLAAAQAGETDTGKVHLIEVETGKLVRSVAGHQYGATDVKFSADGKLVLSTGRDTTLQICQTEDGKEAARLNKPRGGQFKDWLSALAISPDQQWLAAADISGIIHAWHAAT